MSSFREHFQKLIDEEREDAYKKASEAAYKQGREEARMEYEEEIFRLNLKIKQLKQAGGI